MPAMADNHFACGWLAIWQHGVLCTRVGSTLNFPTVRQRLTIIIMSAAAGPHFPRTNMQLGEQTELMLIIVAHVPPATRMSVPRTTCHAHVRNK